VREILRNQNGRHVSIHAFRGEGDSDIRLWSAFISGFNPRLPGGRRLMYRLRSWIWAMRFQSTPSGGKATCVAIAELYFNPQVSIHAFRGEGDITVTSLDADYWIVSIHAFRGEGDVRVADKASVGSVSIHAFRGEGDISNTSFVLLILSFNPRLPGGRRLARHGRNWCFDVSIHAFRGEGDLFPKKQNYGLRRFQSTPSGGKATSA